MKLKDKLKSLGPGLLYAGAAIGVSHLVQSTRAGAEFGYQLAGVILLVNLLKFPVFEIGPRYAAATGKTLLDGYKQLGGWAVWIYVLISVATMFIIMAAITIVTAGLFAQLTQIEISAVPLALVLLVLATIILGFGHYSTLDRVMKLVVLLLTISTLTALAFSLHKPSVLSSDLSTVFDFDNRAHLLFLVALIGWMPAPVDIAIWHSVWSVSKNKSLGKTLTLRQVLTDFHIGYWGTTMLAVCFLSLGASIMYGTGQVPQSNAVGFAEQLINMYTANLGSWTFPIIALAAFTTMFSTQLTCLDAFPRTLRKSTKLLFPKVAANDYHEKIYWFWLLTTAFGTGIILVFYLQDMRSLVDLATTISFVIAPVLAVMNFVVMNGKSIDAKFRQPAWLRWFNLFSIILLCLFSLWYLWY
jgi:Mn2+/Fe2+ NRAMP family transporter